MPRLGLATWIVILGALAALPLCVFLYGSYRVALAELRADAATIEKVQTETAARLLRARLQAMAAQLRRADKADAADGSALVFAPGEVDPALLGATVHPAGAAGLHPDIVLSAFRVERGQGVASLTLRRSAQPGIITAEVSLPELLRDTAALGGFPAFMVDQKGRIVASHFALAEDDGRSGPGGSRNAFINAALVPTLAAAVPVLDAWKVVVPAPGADFAARERSLQQRYAIGGLLSLAVGLALLHFVARWLRSGIKGVAATAEDPDSSSATNSVISEFAEIGDALATARAKAQRNALELELARHDSLTGLPGRELFLCQAQAQLQAARNSEHLGIAVLYLDLDDFKAVNDSFGHAAGDDLLKEVAATLRQCVRTPDVVGRTGGDEFVVCFTAPREQLSELAASACNRITQEVSRLRDGLGCSSGWATATFAADCSLPELIAEADAAMYLVKSARRDEMRRRLART